MQASEVATEVAGALGFAHANGMVHRDIKPANILVATNGSVKVADFGIARAFNTATQEALTQAGAVMGTATYFSPEQAQGLALDPRSDLYALGIVMYEMAAGRPPFTGDNPVTIAYRQVHEAPAPLRQVAARRARRLRRHRRPPAGQEPRAALRARPTTCAPTCGASARARPSQAVAPTALGAAVAVGAAATAAPRPWARSAGTTALPPTTRPGRRPASGLRLRLRRAAPQPGLVWSPGSSCCSSRSPSAAGCSTRRSSNGSAKQVTLPSVIGRPHRRGHQDPHRRRPQGDRGPGGQRRLRAGIVYAQSPQPGPVDEGSDVKLIYNPAASRSTCRTWSARRSDEAQQILTAARAQAVARPRRRARTSPRARCWPRTRSPARSTSAAP